eukprot:sb/3473326/
MLPKTLWNPRPPLKNSHDTPSLSFYSKDYQKKIEEELREANQRIAVLESDVKISNNTTTPTQELMQLQDALSQEKARHRESVEMMEKKNGRIKELEPRVKSAAEAINSLKDIIKKKDDEIKAQEEKYKRFLGKAKQLWDMSKEFEAKVYTRV